MTTRRRAIVFDLDDTLYPERQFVESAYRAVATWIAASFGVSAQATFLELVQLSETGDRGRVLDRWAEAHRPEESGLGQRLVQVYREHTPRIRPFPEVPALLLELRRCYRLGIVSDGFREVQERKIEALGIRAVVDAIALSDEWGRSAWKPDPKPFQIVLERLSGVSPSQAVYVADNPEKDFLGARRAGMGSIRVLRASGVHAHKPPASEAHGATATATDIGQIPTLLATWRWPGE